MRRFIICNVLLAFCALAFAQSEFDAANAAYAEGRYEQAATIYQTLIDEQPDATLYYNLGNAHFKQGELAQAILNYERALRLQPNHKDAQYNLGRPGSSGLSVCSSWPWRACCSSSWAAKPGSARRLST